MKVFLFLVVFAIGWLGVGTLFLFLTALTSPEKLLDEENNFRQDVAFWALLVWPSPLFILLMRGLLWPSKYIANRVTAAKLLKAASAR